jgi:glycosyltransferase involved in cell wall biosynthesis
MKVLFDARVHMNYFCGISRYIICLLDAYLELYKEDEVIILLNPSIDKDNSIYKVLGKYSNVTFKVVNAGHMGPKNYLLMGKIIKQINPDVYHYPHLDAPIFTGNIPIVSTVHDRNSNDNIKKFDDRFGLKSFYFKKTLGLTLKKSSGVIFVSDSVKDEVLNIYGIKDSPKFVRIYNGLEEDFNKQKISSTSNLKGFGIVKPYILYVGQIREHKNIKRILEAFQEFNNELYEYQLVLIGNNYLNLDFNDNSVVHIEKVSNDELKLFYSKCTSFVFPSLFEGFGFPIIEAFSFGKKVITSNYGATKEVGQDFAILVDPYSVQEIADGLKKSIIEDGLSNSRVAYSKTFSWRENAVRMRELYQEAIITKSKL